MASFNPVDRSIRCVVCSRSEMKDGEKLFLLECCKEGVHKSCLRERLNGRRVVCPQCRRETCVHNHVIQKNYFSEKDLDLIDLCFMKHQVVSRIPMTEKEIRGLRVAINVPGLNALRLIFWAPLKKGLYCEWEDVATRLSLGVTYNNLSEMRSRYDLRVKRDGKGDAFHHYLDHLLESAVHDEEVVTRDCVVKTCRCPHCPECQGFVSIFDNDRMSDLVAIANRSYF